MARLRLAAAAREDLRNVRIFSKATFGVSVARDYMVGFDQIFTLLRERPLIGAVQNDLGADIRSFRYRSHRIYYRVVDDLVEIVRILHHAQHTLSQFRNP